MSAVAITVVTTRDRYGLMLEKTFEMHPNVFVAFVSPPGIPRVFRLIRKGSISLRFLMKTLICRLRNIRILSSRKPLDSVSALDGHLAETSTEILIMFRMGILIPEEILGRYRVINVHVAKLPEYAGLGSLLAALDAGDFAQCATAHMATTKVDSGSVLLEIPYSLDPSLTYCRNESVAYAAGVVAVEQLISRFSEPHVDLE